MGKLIFDGIVQDIPSAAQIISFCSDRIHGYGTVVVCGILRLDGNLDTGIIAEAAESAFAARGAEINAIGASIAFCAKL